MWVFYILYNFIGEYRYVKTENNMVVNNVDYKICNRYAELSRYGKWLCPCHLLYYNIKIRYILLKSYIYILLLCLTILYYVLCLLISKIKYISDLSILQAENRQKSLRVIGPKKQGVSDINWASYRLSYLKFTFST